MFVIMDCAAFASTSRSTIGKPFRRRGAFSPRCTRRPAGIGSSRRHQTELTRILCRRSHSSDQANAFSAATSSSRIRL
jgi:hypothetical protein